MSADRRRGFEAWARTNGDAAVRSHDRRGIAEDIFDVAGTHDVDASHIEEVSKRYRERLAGAQKILLARQVGDEILRWQRAPQRSVAPRNPDSRREDDEIIGIELDSMSLSVEDVARAVAEKRAAEQPKQEPVPARDAGRSEPPPSGLGPRVATGSRPLASTAWSASARSGSSSSSSLAAVSPTSSKSSPPPSSSSERARSEGAIDWAAAPRPSSSTRPEADEPGLWASSQRGTSSPAPQSDALPLPPLGLPPAGPAPLSAPPLGPPPAGPPPVTSAIASVPPAPSASSSSHPPSRRPRAPDTQSTTFELEGESLRAVAPPFAAPATSPPIRTSFAVPRAASTGRKRVQAILAGAIFAVLLAVVIAWRVAAALGGRSVEVSGHTVSEHLGISMHFAEPWTHERRKDDESGQLGYRRATSTYFQGVTPEDFIMQLTVVTLSPKDHPAAPDDVRKIGGHQRLQPVTDQTCATVEGAGETYRCLAKTTHKGRSFAVVEQYFLAGSRVVFVRALVEVLADAPPPIPKKGEIAGPIEKPPLVAVVDEMKIQAIIDSIQGL